MCKIGTIFNLLYFHLVFLTVITCRSSYSSVKINGMGTFLTKYFVYLIALDGWLDYNQILNDYNIDSSNYNDDEYYEEVATPRAEASMEVEFLEEEEKIGPSLGRVLGKFGVKFCFQNDNCNIYRSGLGHCDSFLCSRNGIQTLQDMERRICRGGACLSQI